MGGPWRRLYDRLPRAGIAALMVASLALAACKAGSSGSGERPAPGGASHLGATSTTAGSPRPDSRAGWASGVAQRVPSTQSAPETPITTAAAARAAGCPLTRPDPSFEAPPPAPARPPDAYRSGWYGTRDLWTMVDRSGEVWQHLPRDGRGFGQKTFWWSSDWDVNDELEPAIDINGRRLDGPGSFRVGPPGTNAQADFGVAMLQGIEIPSRGCWEITAGYRSATLSIVVWVEDN
jgi:hypothetical protein